MNSSLTALTAEEEDETLTLNLGCTGHSKIHRIEGLERFTRLTHLILNNHMIARIEGLQELRQLKVLNMEFNQIRVLEGLDNLLCLEQLYLSYNSIRSVRQKLDGLPCLRILHLAHNELAIQHISCLAAASQLTILSLHGNPLTKQITYHTLIGLVFAKLVLLDEKEVRRVEVDIMTQQVSFLRGALNQVLQQKNELLAEATKIKRELTSSQSEVAARQDDQQRNTEADDRQEKLFYVQALHQQNRILEQKIDQCQQEISQIKHRQRTINHYQSVKLAQQLEQQAVVEQLSAELERKYTETAKLEKRLEKLQRQRSSKQEQQKVLNQLLNNQTLIQSCHEQSKFVGDVVEAIKRETQEHSLEEQPMEESCGESGAENELEHLESQLERFKQKLDENLFLIRQYRAELRLSRCADDSHLYHQLVFGECNQQVTLENVQEFAEKYPAGLLPTLEELFILTFGTYVPLETIRELIERLKGTPIIKFVLARKEKAEEKKQRSSSKKAFLEEKFNFIREFEKQTKELAQQWSALNQQKQQFESELQAKRIEFYKELELKMKVEEDRLGSRRQAFQEQEQKHQRILNELINEQLHRKGELRQVQLQVEQVTTHFETKFRELEEFERNFAELKAEKSNLNQYHNEIERMKLEGDRLTDELRQRQRCIVDLEQQEQLLQNRVEALQKKSKERLNNMLEIDEKQKQVAQKLSRVVAEHNQILERIELKENELRVLEDETKDYQRNMERAKINFNTWEEKLINLNAIEKGKLDSINELDRQIIRLQDTIKGRVRINEDLQCRRDRLMEESNAYQLKITESKASLDSLTSLNNAISKMSLHHKELKTSLLELQIVYEGKLKEKACLDQSLRELQLEEASLLDRVTKLKSSTAIAK